MRITTTLALLLFCCALYSQDSISIDTSQKQRKYQLEFTRFPTVTEKSNIYYTINIGADNFWKYELGISRYRYRQISTTPTKFGNIIGSTLSYKRLASRRCNDQYFQLETGFYSRFSLALSASYYHAHDLKTLIYTPLIGVTKNDLQFLVGYNYSPDYIRGVTRWVRLSIRLRIIIPSLQVHKLT